MAKVKGITIELSADASGIESALKSVNKELNATQSQLRSVDKSLKLNPESVQLLAQKQQLLSQAVEDTTKKLAALKAAQEDVAKNGGKAGDTQFDALTREISDTEASLKKLKTAQSETAGALSSAQMKASGFGQALSTVGNVCNQVAEKTRALAAASAALLGAMAGIATKAGQQADEWLTLAQQTGLSTDAIQKFAYAADQIDVPLPTITSAITQLKRHLDDTSGVWEKIGVNVRNQKGEYRDIESIFNDVVGALGNIGNETERDEVAMKLFGKSANELAGLIDDGGQKMSQLSQEAENMGMIVSEEDLQTLGEFNDRLDAMKQRLNFAFMKAAVPIAEALAPLLDIVAGALESVGSVLSALPKPLVAVLAVAAGAVVVMFGIVMAIGMVSNALAGLPAVLSMVGQAFTLLSTTMTEALAANPYITAIVIIIAALAVLGFAIYEVVQHWDEIKDGATQAFNGIKSAANNGVSAIQGIAEKIIGAFSGIPGAIKSIGEGFSAMLGPVKEVVTAVISKFNELKQKAFKMGKEMLQAFGDGINSVISSVISMVQKLAQSLSNIWNSIKTDASSAGREAGNAFASNFNSSSNNIRRTTTSSLFSSPSYSPYSSGITYSNGGLVTAMNTLSASIDRYSAAPTSVNVELVGSAKNIFDTVRVQNNTLATATGYHALA